jgi:hypothetical protein
MWVAKFINKERKRISYVPVIKWSETSALVPGENDTVFAGFLFEVNEAQIIGTYGKILSLLESTEVEYDLILSREENDEIEEYYLFSNIVLGDKNGMLSE